MDPARLEQLRDTWRAALLEDVVPFWERHGVDREYGGFLTCLDRAGQPYSTDKPVWFQGRGTWLFATLYDRVEARPQWLAIAQRGAEFLARHCFAPSGKMYFLVTRDGQPLRMRRYVFSEVFATLALAALGKATRDAVTCRRAGEVFESFVRYTQTPGLIEPKLNPTVRPLKSLSPRMCLLNLADTLAATAEAVPGSGLRESAQYEQIIDDCIAEIFRDFVKTEDGYVLEHVMPDGTPIDAPEGRVMNPGHALEVAWFILEVVRRRRAKTGSVGGSAAAPAQDGKLLAGACRIIDLSLERGWDQEFGGLLYFVDVHGRPPTQLEHDMKLWWPHSEALYATLLAYAMTGQPRYAQWYERIHEWTLAHFPDPQFGEWFGYLHRDGTVSTPLKGGIWKGPFHIPRAMLYCWKLLEELSARGGSA
jgi:N-acylglucosamine 2-epimerase